MTVIRDAYVICDKCDAAIMAYEAYEASDTPSDSDCEWAARQQGWTTSKTYHYCPACAEKGD